MATKSELKKRKRKTTLEQYKLYVEMLEAKPHFRENKITPDNPAELSETWDILINQLNASGGPQKTLGQWRRVFTDWKSQVRKKARILRNSVNETGNRGEPEKDLTEIEQRLLHVTGQVVVEGIEGVPELGIQNIENVEKAVEEEKKVEVELKVAKQFSKKKSEDVLIKINNNLQELVDLKRQDIEIQKLKLKLKYDVELEIVD